MKAISFFILLAISTCSYSQQVTYKSLIGTSWSFYDSTKAFSMTFKFIDSSRLSQKSSTVRYQQVMETIMKYTLDTTHNPTLLNVEWKGEILNCTRCTVKISNYHLIIENPLTTRPKKQPNNTEAPSIWIFHKKPVK